MDQQQQERSCTWVLESEQSKWFCLDTDGNLNLFPTSLVCRSKVKCIKDVVVFSKIET